MSICKVAIKWVLAASGLIMLLGAPVRAQTDDSAVNGHQLHEPADEDVPETTDEVMAASFSDLVSDPDWDQLPHRSSRWNIDLAYVPTTVFNDNRDMGVAWRLNLAHEDPDGFGKRGQLWLFTQDLGQIDLFATTFYYDFYKRLAFERGELLFGLGPAAGYVDHANSWRRRYSRQFYGVGASIVAEGFYPLLRFERTDIGPIAHGRLATLFGVWDQNGSLEVGTGSIAVIDQFAWGLELRHRFGRHQDKCYYVDVTREFQNWGSPSLPYVADLEIQGTAVNFGLGW